MRRNYSCEIVLLDCEDLEFWRNVGETLDRQVMLQNYNSFIALQYGFEISA